MDVFEQSEFNVSTKGLYECIVDYLKSKYPKRKNYIMQY